MRLAVSGLPRLVAICSMVFYYPLSLKPQTPPSNKNSLNKTHPDILHITIAYILFSSFIDPIKWPSPSKAD